MTFRGLIQYAMKYFYLFVFRLCDSYSEMLANFMLREFKGLEKSQQKSHEILFDGQGRST